MGRHLLSDGRGLVKRIRLPSAAKTTDFSSILRRRSVPRSAVAPVSSSQRLPCCWGSGRSWSSSFSRP